MPGGDTPQELVYAVGTKYCAGGDSLLAGQALGRKHLDSAIHEQSGAHAYSTEAKVLAKQMRVSHSTRLTFRHQWRS